MILKKNDHSYTTHKKRIQGKGFIDSLSSTLRNIGSYVSQNKDLLAKPMLGAVGNLAALGLTEGGKKLLTHIINKNNKASEMPKNTSPEVVKILQDIINRSPEPPTTNIIGSGARGQTGARGRTGSGIKKF